jgi:hypothetical protein
VALFALAVVVVRVHLDARAAFAAGAQAEQGGRPAEAVPHYLQAARMYLPGSATVRQALDRLEAIARQAEAAGDLTTARAALEAVRAALLGAQSFYTPHAERLPAVERQLAEIYARVEDPAVDPGASPAARAAWHRERLARRPRPAVGPAVMALAGLGVWLGATVLFVRRGLDRGLRLRRSWAAAAAVVFVIGFVMFVVGLRLA